NNGDIAILGSSVNGKEILLDAANDVNLLSAANTVDSDSHSSQKSASVGVDLTQGGVAVSGQLGKGKTDEHSVSYNETTITAEQELTVKSGNDTNLVGAQVKGDTVEIDVKGDLNLASQQDRETYTEKNKSVGGSIGFGAGASVNLSANTGKMDSEYRSVKEQTGIFAGKGGFDIKVVGNTDLDGSVLGSEAEANKNKLSTGTLTFSDIENKAEYKAESNGVGNATGPNLGVPVSDDKTSTTHAAIAQGTIEIKDQANQKADITKLSRDTQNAVNKLDQIFDKKTVQEKQELANLFSQEAVKLVGDIAEREKDRLVDKIINAKNDTEREEAKKEYQLWMESGTNKVLLHAFVGGLTAKFAGGDFMSGAAGAGFNEVVQQELKNIKNPTLHQLASALVGGAATEILGGDAQTGTVTALNGTKYNFLSHWQTGQRDKAILNEEWDKVAYWDRIDKAQNYVCAMMGINYKAINWEDPDNANLLYTVSTQAQQLEADPNFRNSWLVNSPTVDSSTLISAGVVGTAIVIAGVTLYKYNGGWVKAAPVVPGAGALYNNAVNSLNKINIYDFTIKSKHLETINNNTSGWNKFKVGTVDEATALVNSIIKGAQNNRNLIKNVSENPVGSQGQQSFQVLIDAGKVIGTKGETAIRIVYDELGNIWTVFPDKI
ncbi:hemagglutinin repeat-containing protein, partial [Acetonema longum]